MFLTECQPQASFNGNPPVYPGMEPDLQSTPLHLCTLAHLHIVILVVWLLLKQTAYDGRRID